MERIALLGCLTLFILPGLTAQEPDTLTRVVPAAVVGNDTIPLVEVRSIQVFPPYSFKNNRQRKRYSRLVYNVQVAYPYAKLAAKKLAEFQLVMDTITSEPERKRFAKMAEKQLEEEFGDNIRDLTFTQGKILIKLIYRETGNSSFEIVRDLRGAFTAFIWQTLARLFGYNLKQAYEPEGEDQEIEEIILLIDEGYF